ncbi:hypothetical protein [Streptomyces sp. NPDC002540]
MRAAAARPLADGGAFIAAAPASAIDDAVYAALDLDAATVVDCIPALDENTLLDRRETYHVLEDTHVLSGPRKRDPKVEVRRIVVLSTGHAKGQQRAWDRRLAEVMTASGRHRKRWCLRAWGSAG